MSGDSFSFENHVKGGTAQINQGQNVTATQNVIGGNDPYEPLKAAIEELESMDDKAPMMDAVDDLRELLPADQEVQDEETIKDKFLAFAKHAATKKAAIEVAKILPVPGLSLIVEAAFDAAS